MAEAKEVKTEPEVEEEVSVEPDETVSAGNEDDDAPLTTEEREILRQQRREERKDAKVRKREAIARKDRYIAQLENQLREQAGRLDQLESRSTGQDIARLDSAIDSAAQEIELAKAAKSEARKANEADIEAEADDALYNARRKHEELTFLKKRINEGQRVDAARRSTGTASAPNPRVVENASRWAQEHSWYSRTGNDTDSEIVRVVDVGMAREGWDPATEEYWEELDERLKNRLPHRYKARKQITGGGAGESPNESSGIRLSKERIDAMKEAGIWDDPKRRARMIKRYQDADKASAERG